MKWKDEHRIRQEQRDMEVVALQFWAYRIQAQVNGQNKFYDLAFRGLNILLL